MECGKGFIENQATEVIVIDDDDSEPVPTSKIPPKTKKNFKKKPPKNTRKIKISNSNIDFMETLVVTQKVEVKKRKIQFTEHTQQKIEHVEVKKQKFKCIINITKVCDHENDNADVKANSKVDTPANDRIVPQCLRKCFRRGHTKKKCNKRDSMKCLKQEPKEELCPANDLSPISLSSFSINTKMSYDNVSSDSFATYYSEDEIDTLIKRTKDRERRLSNLFDKQTSRSASTFIYNGSITSLGSSNVDSLNSELNSNHSVTKQELEIQPMELYSPTRPTRKPYIDQRHILIPENNITPQINHEHYPMYYRYYENTSEKLRKRIDVKSEDDLISSMDRERKYFSDFEDYEKSSLWNKKNIPRY